MNKGQLHNIWKSNVSIVGKTKKNLCFLILISVSEAFVVHRQQYQFIQREKQWTNRPCGVVGNKIRSRCTKLSLDGSGGGWDGFGRFKGGGGGNNRGGGGGGGGDEEKSWFSSWDSEPEQSWNETKCCATNIRGGGSIRSGGRSSRSKSENAIHDAHDTISSSASYWHRAFHSIGSTITRPFRAAGKGVSNTFKSKQKKREEEVLKQLQSMPIRHVTVPNSTLLPQDVIELAARRSGVLGHPLKTDTVQDFARAVQRWYHRKGYVLHSVTGATLRPETGTAEIAVQEPITAQNPVGITFCREMVADNETGELMTFRQYKDKHTRRKTLGLLGHDTIDKTSLNTSMVPTTGRTNPAKLARALRLEPGQPFQWDGLRWQRILQSGVFKEVLRATPQQMRDGTVQLHILAVEAPLRHLEYGVGRSLYTGYWEGELEFEHGNLLGGGETLGVRFKRGTKDATPSVRLSFSDTHFGMASGCDVELFSDCLGIKSSAPKVRGAARAASEQDVGQNVSIVAQDIDHDGLLDRKGATLRFRFPPTRPTRPNTIASASIERTTTTAGLHEIIGTSTLNVGPFVKDLPYNARSNIDFKITTGSRLANREPAYDEVEPDDLLSKVSFLPFASATATTRQIFPLIAAISPKSRRPLTLALQHSLTTSTQNLPRHEAIAQGSYANIRGVKENGRISSSLQGVTELRLPVDIPMQQLDQDASVVLFGDWLLASSDINTPLSRKSSVGVGLRKSVQGIPLKIDLTYSKELKLKTSFGLGRDFDF